MCVKVLRDGIKYMKLHQIGCELHVLVIVFQKLNLKESLVVSFVIINLVALPSHFFPIGVKK